MSTRKIVFVIMLLTLAIPNRLGIVLAAPRRAVSDWKMPLPSGEYEVPQGDQDSCYDTHCKDYVYGNQNTYCAIDLWVSSIAGMPVLAPADGKVIDVGYQAVGAGNYVYILHDDGFVSHYEHLQKVYVELNARLKQGQPFARVGATGSSDRRAWQEHLHFTVKTERNGTCVKLSSLDGNTDFKTNATVKSSNVQVGTLPDDLPAPIPPAPPVTPPSALSNVSECSNTNIDSFLSCMKSPLNGLGQTFIQAGQLYNVDPRFIIAISNAESSLGKNLCAPYNAWGEMKPGTGTCQDFNSWQDSIDFVTAHIGNYYLPKGQNNIPSFVIRPGGTCTSHCWCASGCDNWVRNVGDAYVAMGGNRNATDLTFAAYSGGSIPPIPTTPAPPSSLARPSLSNPINDASMTQSANVTLSWNTSTNATQYKVELWGGSYSMMTPCDWQSRTSCQIGTMYPGVMQWHVKARTTSGQESDWSDTWTFTIQGPTETPPTKTPTPPPQAPDSPTLRDPSDGARYPQSQDIWFAWNYISNADQYYLEYWGGPYGRLNSGWINDVAYHIGTMWSGQYKWHVKARGQNGVESNWSDTWSFTIQDTPQLTNTPASPTAPPSAGHPTLSSPDNGSSWPQSADITLVWNAASNATRYKVELWGGPYSTMVPCDWQSGTSCHIGQMWPGTMSWHVKARNSNGQETDWSDTWSFTIQDVPKPPTDTPRPSFNGNIAPRANRSPDGSGSGNAFDGNLSTFWTDGLGHGFTLTLSLPGSFDISRILVWDRPQNSPDNQQINQIIISLSNGWNRRFDMNSGGPRCIDVTLSSPQTITSVTLKADDASGNNGLSEVEIWVGSKTGGPTCSNSGTMP